ncbi:MAG: SBBP repeat-containing protein [Bacteroidia bacterium]
MRIIALNLFGIIFSHLLSAQPELVWAKQMKGSSDILCDGTAITTDKNGNIYSTGWFTGTVDFDPGPGTFQLSTLGNQNMFVSKLDADGNFLWAVQVQNMGTAVSYGTQISLDTDENIVIAGAFFRQVDFDPGATTFLLNTTSATGGDIFIAKFNKNSNFLWAKQLAGTNANNYPYSLAVDSLDNIYVSGEFKYTVDFDPGPGTFNLTATDYRNGFVLKLDGNGNFQWAGNILDGPGSNGATVSMNIDTKGDIYVSGSFHDTVELDPGPNSLTVSSVGKDDMFISKLNNNGNLIWSKTIGGIENILTYSLAVDGSDEVYVSGYFSGTVDFDPGPGIYNLTSPGEYFVLKLTSAGVFVWAKKFAEGGGLFLAGNSIFTDSSNDVFITGVFHNTADFDPSIASYNLSAKHSMDYFILKLTGAGDFQYAGHLATQVGFQRYEPLPICLHNDYIYALGDILGTGDVDPESDSFLISSTGYSDLFVLKLRQYREFTLGEDTTTCAGDIFTIIPKSIYPNDKILWSTGDTTPTLSITKTGTYFVEVKDQDTTYYDTITVTFLPKPTIYVGPDTAFCDFVDHLLQPTSNGSHFLWNTGDTTKDLRINKDGTYSLLVKSSQMCENADTVKVDKINSPFGFASDDTSVCGDRAVLDAKNGGNTYLWNTGEISQKIEVMQDGLYSVTISNGFCTTADSIHVTACPANRLCSTSLPAQQLLSQSGWSKRNFPGVRNCDRILPHVNLQPLGRKAL